MSLPSAAIWFPFTYILHFRAQSASVLSAGYSGIDASTILGISSEAYIWGFFRFLHQEQSLRLQKQSTPVHDC